jgi:hypothetical protein
MPLLSLTKRNAAHAHAGVVIVILVAILLRRCGCGSEVPVVRICDPPPSLENGYHLAGLVLQPSSNTINMPSTGHPSKHWYTSDAAHIQALVLDGDSQDLLTSTSGPAASAKANSTSAAAMHSGLKSPIPPNTPVTPLTPTRVMGGGATSFTTEALSTDTVASTARTRGKASSQKVNMVKNAVASAVQQMQGALQAELQEEQLEVFSVLGRGGFGTVYHGAP